jgi:hypothetical protein
MCTTMSQAIVKASLFERVDPKLDGMYTSIAACLVVLHHDP